MRLSHFAFIALMIVSTSCIYAQDMQMFSVHEDRVYPSKIADYEMAAKGLVAQMKKYNVQGADYLALALDDYRYIYISPIDNMAQLDKDPFANLAKDLGDSATKKMWAAFDGCYDEHGDYILSLDADLSYQPGGIDPNPEGQYYRNLDYWYCTSANVDDLVAIARKVKAANEAAGSEFYYRVYRGGFGIMGPVFMVASAAKSPADWWAKVEASQKKTGDKVAKLMEEALRLTTKFESFTGMMRPDLGYTSRN